MAAGTTFVSSNFKESPHPAMVTDPSTHDTQATLSSTLTATVKDSVSIKGTGIGVFGFQGGASIGVEAVDSGPQSIDPKVW